MGNFLIQTNIPIFHLAYMKHVPLIILLFQQVVEFPRRSINALKLKWQNPNVSDSPEFRCPHSGLRKSETGTRKQIKSKCQNSKQDQWYFLQKGRFFIPCHILSYLLSFQQRFDFTLLWHLGFGIDLNFGLWNLSFEVTLCTYFDTFTVTTKQVLLWVIVA